MPTFHARGLHQSGALLSSGMWLMYAPDICAAPAGILPGASDVKQRFSARTLDCVTEQVRQCGRASKGLKRGWNPLSLCLVLFGGWLCPSASLKLVSACSTKCGCRVLHLRLQSPENPAVPGPGAVDPPWACTWACIHTCTRVYTHTWANRWGRSGGAVLGT